MVPVKKVVTRPQTLDEKIADAKVDIGYETKRIYTCSWIFLVTGAIGFFWGVNKTFNARTEAAFLRTTHQLPWGNPNFTNWTILNATNPIPDRVEITFFDLIRYSYLLKAAISFLIFMMGM